MLTASGHAELELADGRWVRMTANATSEGGSIIFFSDFTAIKEREENLAQGQAGSRSRQRRQDPLPGQYEP